MAVTRIVVVGADAAGMSAAHQALRTGRARGRALEVVALERTRHTSYSACGIPYWIAGDVAGAGDLTVRSVEEHRALGVDLRTGAAATGLDLAGGVVSYRTEGGAEQTMPYDELVLATGAIPIVPSWARTDSGNLVPGVHPVKDLDDGAHWVDLLASHRPQAAGSRAVVVGGGYLGVEMAETLARRGWSATLITRSSVMSSLDPDLGSRVRTAMEAAGLDVVAPATVDGLERGTDGRVSGVTTRDGATIPADVVVLALGVTPASGVGREAGLAVGGSGGYLTDASGRVADGVWAAGDCCEARHRLTGASVFLPLGTHANKQGRVVGTCLGGGEAGFGGVLGTAITRFVAAGQHVEISHTGLGTAEAEAAGLSVMSLVTEGTTASGYMPEAAPIAIKVLAEVGTRRLLGVQIVGGPGAGKRVDAAAAALWGGLSVDDLAWMDLSYAPPFATAWEVLQVAARRLAERM